MDLTVNQRLDWFDSSVRSQIYAVVVIWVMAADCLSELGGFDSLRRRQIYTSLVQWIGYDATNVGMVVRFHHGVPILGYVQQSHL